MLVRLQIENISIQKKQLRDETKTMRVGIHFGDVQFTEESGEISVPLVQ